jgi:hypothetical protein
MLSDAGLAERQTSINKKKSKSKSKNKERKGNKHKNRRKVYLKPLRKARKT